MSTEVLSKIFHDFKDPGSLGGGERVLRRSRQLHVPVVTRQTVQEYLRSEQAYTLHKPTRRRFTRNQTYVAGIDAQWQADLADMQGIARQNSGMRYILTVIDVFSKFPWAIPVNSNDAKAIMAVFKQVLTAANLRHPRRIQTDKNKEFFNSDFQTLMKRHGIQHFANENEQKTARVERFNRTINTRIWTYLSDRGNVRWVDVIQDLETSYNHWRPALSAWGWPMFRRRTRTDSGFASSGTETPTLNFKFRRELLCGPAATNQFLTRATCQSIARSTIQLVKRCHLQEGLSAAYISWWTTTMKL